MLIDRMRVVSILSHMQAITYKYKDAIYHAVIEPVRNNTGGERVCIHLFVIGYREFNNV